MIAVATETFNDLIKPFGFKAIFLFKTLVTAWESPLSSAPKTRQTFSLSDLKSFRPKSYQRVLISLCNPHLFFPNWPKTSVVMHISQPAHAQLHPKRFSKRMGLFQNFLLPRPRYNRPHKMLLFSL